MSKIKVVAISDTHGHLPDIPECDLLLVAGDICPTMDHSIGFQECWLDSAFRYWLKNQPAKQIVGCAGNHDYIFETPSRVPKDLKWKYLQDDYTWYEDFMIYGTPWQPYFFGWAFNLYEPDLEKKWEKVPLDTEILVLHSPPYGYGDEAARMLTDENETEWPSTERTGSPSLLKKIDELKDLKLAVFGHIHPGYGKYERDGKILANVSYLDNKYQPGNPIMNFTLEK